MAEPPVRIGWYCIQTDAGEACYYWDGDAWFASEDPLDFVLKLNGDAQWYGQSAPFDGLDVE